MRLVKYPHKFSFGHFFSSLRVTSLCLSGDDKNLRVSFSWEAWVKMTKLIFSLVNAFSSNLNTKNLNISPNRWDTRVWQKIQQMFSGEVKP